MISESEIWSIANAVLLSIGGGGVLVFALSSWIGKVWATRILEKEKSEINKEYANFKSKLDMDLYQHNVAFSRLDAQRADAIRELYSHLVAWHTSLLKVLEPSDLSGKPEPWVLAKYASWVSELKENAWHLRQSTMQTAIYFCEETYALIEKYSASTMNFSNEFSACFDEADDLGSSSHRARVESVRSKFVDAYEVEYEQARLAVARAFRQLLDPLSSTTKNSGPSS